MDMQRSAVLLPGIAEGVCIAYRDMADRSETRIVCKMPASRRLVVIALSPIEWPMLPAAPGRPGLVDLACRILGSKLLSFYVASALTIRERQAHNRTLGRSQQHQVVSLPSGRGLEIMRQTFAIIGAIGVTVLLSWSCSPQEQPRDLGSPPPSASDPTSAAKALLEERCSKESNGYLRLTKFTKHDAVLGKENGVDYYQVKYSLEAEALKDGGYVNICDSKGKDAGLMSFEVRDRAN
jgi:hypothetical protein